MPPIDESARAISRRKTKVAGDRSSKLARDLMKIGDATFARLGLHEDLHATVKEARSISSMTARRRAERALAGTLRHEDIRAISERLANVATTGAAEQARLHLAEKWRARLLEEGTSAIAEFPPGDPDAELPRLIAAAAREKTSGKPPGAARALFRHLVEALKVHETEADSPSDDDDESDDDSDDDESDDDHSESDDDDSESDDDDDNATKSDADAK